MRAARQQIESFTKLVDPKQTLNVVDADPDVNRIVECAVEAGSQFIVTHDSDLLRMTRYEGIEIMKVGAIPTTLGGRTDRGRLLRLVFQIRAMVSRVFL